ncbi:MAG TPA: SDR family oxidoreductase [Firmicutes bacterium]|nr:SDR family oxidoreductase [Bacillota bacterium]
MSMQGKVCVVTGGALGIGQCLTREFAKRGCKIAFLDKDRAAGEKNLDWLHAHGFEALFVHGDAGKQQDLERFAHNVTSHYGQVDILLNNACFSNRGLQSACGYEDFLEVLRVGVAAPYYLTQLFLPVFTPYASIVNLSSTRARQSQADTESYTAAKGGISALTHAMAVSLSGKVRVNSISPGWIETQGTREETFCPQYSKGDLLQHPSARVGTPEDIARAALFLCEEENDFINAADLVVDGGMSHLMVYHADKGWEYHPDFHE